MEGLSDGRPVEKRPPRLNKPLGGEAVRRWRWLHLKPWCCEQLNTIMPFERRDNTVICRVTGSHWTFPNALAGASLY